MPFCRLKKAKGVRSFSWDPISVVHGVTCCDKRNTVTNTIAHGAVIVTQPL